MLRHFVKNFNKIKSITRKNLFNISSNRTGLLKTLPGIYSPLLLFRKTIISSNKNNVLVCIMSIYSPLLLSSKTCTFCNENKIFYRGKRTESLLQRFHKTATSRNNFLLPTKTYNHLKLKHLNKSRKDFIIIRKPPEPSVINNNREAVR